MPSDRRALIAVKFKPEMVDDAVATAIEYVGAEYEYLADGSIVTFTPLQLQGFWDYVKAYAKDEGASYEEKRKVILAMEHVQRVVRAQGN
jgi:hypothetical protein